MTCANGKAWCPSGGRTCLACEREARAAATPVATAVTPPPVVRRLPSPAASVTPTVVATTSTASVSPTLPRRSPLHQPVTPPLAVLAPASVHLSAATTSSPVAVVGLRGGGIASSDDAKQKFREKLAMVSTWSENVRAMEQRIAANGREFGTVVPAEWSSLAEEEQVAVWMYTKQYFRFWNGALYTDNRSQLRNHAAAIELFKNGLAKLPRHDGAVFRGEAEYATRHDAQTQGGTLSIKAFWSTTRDETLLKTAGQFGGAIRYEIATGHEGRLIEFVSESAKEREVLFLPNASFEITDRTGDQKKRQTVEIKVRQT